MTSAEKLAVALIQETAAIEEAHMAGDHVTRSMLKKRLSDRWPAAFRKQKAAATKTVRDVVHATRRNDEQSALNALEAGTALIAKQFEPYAQ